jgi:putative DNA primase/helicase
MEISKMKLSDLVRVVSTLHDIDDDQYFIELEFRDVEGNAKRTVLPRSLMRSGSKALDELLKRGANLPGRHGAGAELRELLTAAPGPIRRITCRVGWRGPSFVLPDVTIGPDAETLRYRQSEPTQDEKHVKGSLSEWRDQLRTPCLASSYLTFGVGLGLAGPLLQLIRQDEGVSFYLSWKS